MRVEIYSVFPNNSDVGRTSGPPTFSTDKVPTRVNSPSDVAIVERDVADGNLTFSTTTLAASFTAAKSVINGINPKPNQTTGGEGPVTGTEVEFNVSFTTPIDLPAGHYFFIPQVEVNERRVFWLSAPKPIVPPGTPFPPGLPICRAGFETRTCSPTGCGSARISSAATRPPRSTPPSR